MSAFKQRVKMDFGFYTLKGVEFQFIFDGEKLSLFPKDEANKQKATELTHRKLANGAYAFPGEPIEAARCLNLFSQAHGKTLVLYPVSSHYSIEDFFSENLTLEVGGWFLIEKGSEVSGMSVRSQVLDHAYDIQRAIAFPRFDSDGNIEIKSTEEESQSFTFEFEGRAIVGHLSHAGSISYISGELPIKIQSQLSLSFAPTTDYGFLYNLATLVHRCLTFIAQGYGYEYDNIRLTQQRVLEDGQAYTSPCAELIDKKAHRNCKCPKKIIPLTKPEDISEKVFKSLAKGILITEHLPKIDEKFSYDIARLILMLATLDKTLEQIYKMGIAHSEKAIESREAINASLDALASESVSIRIKKDTAWLKRILNETETLQARLSQFGKDHKSLFEALHCTVYSSPQKRTAFFGRITKMRNKISHGDFDIFDEFSFDDIEGINKLLLSSQLVIVGIEDDEIIAAIVNEIY